MEGINIHKYTDRDTPWTRIIEHKWFEFGKDENGNDLPKTIISKEFSSEWKPGDEPYYPVNDERNSKLYLKYKTLADKEEKVIFGDDSQNINTMIWIKSLELRLIKQNNNLDYREQENWML